METRERNSHGLTRMAPTTAFEIELVQRVLRGMTTTANPAGVRLQVADYLGDGWYKLYAIGPEPEVPFSDEPIVIDLKKALDNTINNPQPFTPWVITGRIGVLEREYPVTEAFRIDLCWQYDGDIEYWGGDGPLANGSFLLRNKRS